MAPKRSAAEPAARLVQCTNFREFLLDLMSQIPKLSLSFHLKAARHAHCGFSHLVGRHGSVCNGERQMRAVVNGLLKGLSFIPRYRFED